MAPLRVLCLIKANLLVTSTPAAMLPLDGNIAGVVPHQGKSAVRVLFKLFILITMDAIINGSVVYLEVPQGQIV